jgi:uncharacterized protein (DUF4415 family)
LVDDENPELDAATILRARPASEVLPKALFEQLTKPDVASVEAESETVSVTLRLDRVVLDRFKSAGPNWRKRINEALRKASGQ